MLQDCCGSGSSRAVYSSSLGRESYAASGDVYRDRIMFLGGDLSKNGLFVWRMFQLSTQLSSSRLPIARFRLSAFRNRSADLGPAWKVVSYFNVVYRRCPVESGSQQLQQDVEMPCTIFFSPAVVLVLLRQTGPAPATFCLCPVPAFVLTGSLVLEARRQHQHSEEQLTCLCFMAE